MILMVVPTTSLATWWKELTNNFYESYCSFNLENVAKLFLSVRHFKLSHAFMSSHFNRTPQGYWKNVLLCVFCFVFVCLFFFIFVFFFGWGYWQIHKLSMYCRLAEDETDAMPCEIPSESDATEMYEIPIHSGEKAGIYSRRLVLYFKINFLY